MYSGTRRQDKIVEKYGSTERKIEALYQDLLTHHQPVNLLADTETLTIDILRTLIINDGTTAGRHLDGSPRMFCVTVGEACCEECKREGHCNQGSIGFKSMLQASWDWVSESQWHEPGGEILCPDTHNSKFKTVAKLLTPEVMKLIGRISLTICSRDSNDSRNEQDIPGLCSALQNIKRYIPNPQLIEINYSCSCTNEGRLPTHPIVPKPKRRPKVISGPHARPYLHAPPDPPPLPQEFVEDRQRTSFERTGLKDALEYRQDQVKDMMGFIPTPTKRNRSMNPLSLIPRYTKEKQRSFNLSEDTMRRRRRRGDMGMDGGSFGGLYEAPISGVGFELSSKIHDPDKKVFKTGLDGSREFSQAEETEMEGIAARDFAPSPKPVTYWKSFIKRFTAWTVPSKKDESNPTNTKKEDSKPNPTNTREEHPSSKPNSINTLEENDDSSSEFDLKTRWLLLIERFRGWLMKKKESSTSVRKKRLITWFDKVFLLTVSKKARKERQRKKMERKKVKMMIWRLERRLPEGKRVRHLHGELWKYYKQELWMNGGRDWWQ